MNTDDLIIRDNDLAVTSRRVIKRGNVQVHSWDERNAKFIEMIIEHTPDRTRVQTLHKVRA